MSSLKTNRNLIHGFYVGYWRDSTMHYSRKVFPLLTCLKDIGGMNSILTLIGSWLNLIFCAGLVKVYIAEAYSQIAAHTKSVQYKGGFVFKLKTMFRHHLTCCKFDKEFENERDHVEAILKEMSYHLSMTSLQMA